MPPILNRIALIVVCLGGLMLGACGFQPLYGGAGYGQLPGLEIVRGQDRVDYLLDDALRDYLGNGRSPYRLELSTDVQQIGLGLSATGLASQYALQLTTDYRLVTRDGALIAEGRVRDEALFDAGSDPYSLISGVSNAEAQAAEAVAERLVQDIAIALRRREAGLAR